MFSESGRFSMAVATLVLASLLPLMLGQPCIEINGGASGDPAPPDDPDTQDPPPLAQAIGFMTIEQLESVNNFELMLLTDREGTDSAILVDDGPSRFLMQIQADDSVDVYSDTISPLFNAAAGSIATPDGLNLPDDLPGRLTPDGILMMGFDAHFAGRCPRPADDVTEDVRRGARFACLVQDFRDGDQSLLTDVRTVLDAIADVCPAMLTVTDVSGRQLSCDDAISIPIQLEVSASLMCSNGIDVFLDRTKLDVHGDEIILPVVGPQSIGQDPLLVNVDMNPPGEQPDTRTIEVEIQILGRSTATSIDIETPACGL